MHSALTPDWIRVFEVVDQTLRWHLPRLRVSRLPSERQREGCTRGKRRRQPPSV